MAPFIGNALETWLRVLQEDSPRGRAGWIIGHGRVRIQVEVEEEIDVFFEELFMAVAILEEMTMLNAAQVPPVPQRGRGRGRRPVTAIVEATAGRGRGVRRGVVGGPTPREPEVAAIRPVQGAQAQPVPPIGRGRGRRPIVATFMEQRTEGVPSELVGVRASDPQPGPSPGAVRTEAQPVPPIGRGRGRGQRPVPEVVDAAGRGRGRGVRRPPRLSFVCNNV